MYNGWLKYGGIEIINAARTKAYAAAFLPAVEINFDTTGLAAALGKTYVSPAADGAPWYRATRAATGRFYGLFPGPLDGADNSTRAVETTEVLGNGATHSKPRFGSLEIKQTVMALAADDEAMSEGLAWLRDSLATGDCGSGCTDNDLQMYSNLPTDGALDAHMLRTFLRVEVLDAPKVVAEFPHRRGVVAKRLEFIFNAGLPWAFTPRVVVGSVDPSTGSTFSDPAGENCYDTNNAYTGFVNDPYYTAIAKPPAPPVIKPPNLLKPASWRRKSLGIIQAEVDRHGRVAPIVTVSTGGAGATMLRVRFYGNPTVSGCGFEGEFVISYIPANAVMVIDARKEEITLTLPGGASVPGGHLVYGSDGLPLKWPSLGCAGSYTMYADILPGQTGITVSLESSVRE